MLVKTEVIVLKSMRYRDTSKIVTFYSREFGKLKGIAKGARTAKNKFGSALEPLSHSLLLLYKKEHRDLHLISQCDLIDSFHSLTDDLDRISAALSVLQLTDNVTHHEERATPLFDLLIGTLSSLNNSTRNYATYLYAFQLRLAALFGYAANFETCGHCGKPVPSGENEKQIIFQINSGILLCSACNSTAEKEKNVNGQRNFISLSVQGLQIIRRLVNAQIQSLSNLDYSSYIGNEIDELLRLYLRYHFEEMKPLKSEEFFKQKILTI